jgi:APA family basic amino acid/polyamine antiporter
VHPEYRTPYKATWITGILVALLAGVVQLGEAADMTNIGTLFAFLIVSIGVVVLRHTKPYEHRPFRTPFMPWLPILSALACLGLMAFLPLVTWIRFGIWSAIGVVVYFAYSMRRSHLNRGSGKNNPVSGSAGDE